MNGITKENAEVIGLVSTAIFACIIWLYALQGGAETTAFITIGIIIVLMDIFALWCISMKTKSKKRGKK